MKILEQLKSAGGNFSFATRMANPWAYWTLTSWENKESMMKFRNSGPHLEAMKNVRKIASKAESAQWEASALPSWSESKKLLVTHQTLKY